MLCGVLNIYDYESECVACVDDAIGDRDQRVGLLAPRRPRSVDGDSEFCLESNPSVDGDREPVCKMTMDAA